MVSTTLRALARIRVTVVYAVILAGVTTALLTLTPAVQSRIISHASTNLHNLSHGHVGTLLISAFVVDAGPFYVWLPGLVCLLALAELLWRSLRVVVVFAAGHLGATLLVGAGLTAAVELGYLSTDITRATDVGMSYGASAVLGSLGAAIPPRWRPAWAGWWIAVAVAVAGVGRDFTDIGHAVALFLGTAIATRFGQPTGWTPLRYLLLVPAASFGFLMLVNSAVAVLVSVGLGVPGALIAEAMARRLGRRAARVA
ncbi:rhomboid-like protein [Mycobacterium sp. 1274761.0]|uniref:rhomboid-like protein n=1 Tax=Mycobacterium sp. 1274761.0 TaxID=1834077 RepID=UPI0007FBD263|nr:rhomboid-like protein [Mycobacterium sp. 1274761.0]OBK71094.1 hypothetical protein A5651_19865 [Mycobacterium sp. 1274761.0]